MKQVRARLFLSDSHPALAIYDSFKAQFTPRVLNILDTNNIYVVGVPPNCTSHLQPMDLSVNKSLKDSLRRSFQNWYASQIHLQLADGGNHEPVDFRLSILKPLSAQWFIDAFMHVEGNPDIVKNGFLEAGIIEKLK